jgi:Holliday junction resolvase RusA-like endonuclease
MQLILLWKPLSTQHLYWQRWRIRYMKKEAKVLKEYYVSQIQEQYKWSVLKWDLEVYIKLVFWDKRKRDIDNWHKLTLDAMTWLIYNDDSQIIKFIVEKSIDKMPRIEIEILQFNK